MILTLLDLNNDFNIIGVKNNWQAFSFLHCLHRLLFYNLLRVRIGYIVTIN